MKSQYGKWKIEKTLSEGNCYLAKSVDTGELGAIKFKTSVAREVEILKKLDHPNVVKLIDYDLEHDEPYMVTEYCRGGALGMVQYRLKDVSTLAINLLIRGLYDGIIHCLSRGYYKNWTALHNIFLRTESLEFIEPVIGDFESTSKINSIRTMEESLNSVHLLIEKIKMMPDDAHSNNLIYSNPDPGLKLAFLNGEIKRLQGEIATIEQTR